MLRHLKLGLIRSAQACGICSVFLNSRWRQQRLLILCYHGISMNDEHEWQPTLYMPPDLLRRRFEALVRHRCSVLSLSEGIERLYRRDLPPRSVAITFDDGTADFHSVALPILREFGFPATLYYSTYYSQYNRPVFDIMCSYLLWKASTCRLRLPGILDGDVTVSKSNCAVVADRIKSFASGSGMSGVDKDALLTDLAARLKVDYDAICRTRMLHLMTPAETREVACPSISVELHTHRHRVSRNRTRFQREIIQNRQYIAAITSAPTRHFCYPSGVYLPEYSEWLREVGVASATTCDPGLAAPDSDPYLLPRFVDTSLTTDAEFSAWISGFGALLPARPRPPAQYQFLEDQPGDPIDNERPLGVRGHAA